LGLILPGCGGGGGGDTSSTASSPADSAPAPAMGMPGDEMPGDMMAADPTTTDGSGAAMGDAGMPGGMPGDATNMEGMGMMPAGGDMSMMTPPDYSAMGAMPGMSDPTMGMPGMGMPGMGMPGMGMGGPAFEDPAPAEDADYMSKAQYAFAIGKEVAAEQYAIAEILANDADAAGLLQQVRWSPSLRKLAMTLRFAVGVDLKAPGNIQDYKPIGRTPFANNGQNGGGSEMNMGMSGMPGASGGAQGSQKNFGDLTGRFGEDFIKTFETAWDGGGFGTIFKDIETIVPVVRPAGMANAMGMGMGMGMEGMSPGMMGDMSGMPGGMAGMPGMGPDGTPLASADPALRERAVPGKQMVPGLLYLGTGSQSELAGKAEAEGVDYLFIFEVEVKGQRNGISNDTRLKLIAAKDQAAVGATTTLNNMKVDRAMAMKGDSDDVAKQLTNLFRKVEGLKFVDLPKLQPVHAQARIKSLIEKKTKDILPILMEIKLFHSIGLLNDEERDAGYQLTAGGNGLAFVSGTPEDREFVLSPLLPAYK
ncbi:MAG: hypothetical protein IT423_02960, partial [Pirellulaceae bacterium]|nr:hypothetical protein [Pirellulaceae bacterium]